MSFLEAHEVMAGDEVAEIEMRGPIFLNSRGEKRLAVPGCTFELACKRGARGAIKRVRRTGRGRLRRTVVEA
jgi:hypothetical protein